MKEEYKGFEIEYSEFGEEFQAKIGDSSYSNKSLTKVKEYINKLLKPKFKRVPVLVGKYKSGGHEYIKAELTSEITGENWKGEEIIYCWVIYNNKSRSKEEITKTKKDCPENLDKIQTINEFHEKIKIIQQEIEIIEESLLPYESQLKQTE